MGAILGEVGVKLICNEISDWSKEPTCDQNTQQRLFAWKLCLQGWSNAQRQPQGGT